MAIMEPNHNPSSQWLSPAQCTEYQRVRALYESHHMAGPRWDELCSVIVALPTLLGHHRVFERLDKVLQAPVIQELRRWSAVTWLPRVEIWRDLLQAWPGIREEYVAKQAAAKPCLSDLDPTRPPRDRRAPDAWHPMKQHGLTAAPLSGVLWIRHAFLDKPDPAQRDVARRFEHLQTMMTVLVIQMKWNSGRAPQDYVQHTPLGSHEFAPLPISIAPACRAARWLALSGQAGYVAELPDNDQPLDYALEMSGWADDLAASLPDDQRELTRRAREYSRSLAAFFDYFRKLLEPGYNPERARRTRFGRPHKPGEIGPDTAVSPINWSGTAAQAPSSSSQAPNSPKAIDLEGWEDPSLSADRAAGLAQDDLEGLVLPLVSQDKIERCVSATKWGAMRAATASVVLPWPLNRYTPEQVAALATQAAQTIAAGEASPQSSLLADGALLALMTLATGRSPSLLAELRAVRITYPAPGAETGQPLTSQAPSAEVVDRLRTLVRTPLAAPLLVVVDQQRGASPDVTGRPGNAGSVGTPGRAIALVLPTIGPKLGNARDEREIDLGALNASTLAPNIVLPAEWLGDLVLARLGAGIEAIPEAPVGDEEPRPADAPDTDPPETTRTTGPTDPIASLRVVGAPVFASLSTLAVAPKTSLPTPDARPQPTGPKAAPAAVGIVDAFLARVTPPTGHARWTVAGLQSHMAQVVETATGDCTLAWILTGDSSRMGQARLHYTQYSLGHLASVWASALPEAGLGPVASVAALQPAQGLSSLEPLWGDAVQVFDLVAGAPFVPTVEQVASLVKAIQDRIQATAVPSSRSQVLKHHDALVLYTLVVQTLDTSMRAILLPVAAIRAIEQHDLVGQEARAARPFKRASPLPPQSVAVGLADKDTYYDERARLVTLGDMLVEQWRILCAHCEALVDRLDKLPQLLQEPAPTQVLFVFNGKLQFREASVAWMEQRLAELGFAWPANFARSFLRTRLLERGCAPADLDAFLGHRDPSGGAIGLHSTFDYRLSQERLTALLGKLHEEIGLRVMPSALVPQGAPPELRTRVLAPMEAAGPKGRGRSSKPRKQDLPTDISDFWLAVHKTATDTDRVQVPLVFRLLARRARHGNAFAQLLTSGDDPVERLRKRLFDLEASDVRRTLADSNNRAASDTMTSPATSWVVCDLELARAIGELVDYFKRLGEARTRARFKLATSWFRLLANAQRRLMAACKADLPKFPLVAATTPTPSPFTEKAVLGLPLVDGWRQAVFNWCCSAFPTLRERAAPKGPASAPAAARVTAPRQHSEHEFPPEAWATALLMSAALNGMLLNRTELALLLRRFSEGPRDLPVLAHGSHAYLDFHVPASGAVDRQTHRWFLDPISELIWLNAPAMPGPLTLKDIIAFLRRIALFAFKGSATVKFEPTSFGDLLRGAELWWLAHASRSVVAGARRQVDSSSLQTERWAQIQGVNRLRAPARLAEAARPAPPPGIESLCLISCDGGTRQEGEEQSEQEAVSVDQEIASDLQMLHPWVFDITDALRKVQRHPAELDAAEVRRMARTCSPAVRDLASVLADFAIWLASPTGAAFSGPPLPRCFNAAARALLLGSDTAFDADTPGSGGGPSPTDPQAIADLIDAASELPVQAGATAKSVREALLALARFLGILDRVRELLGLAPIPGASAVAADASGAAQAGSPITSDAAHAHTRQAERDEATLSTIDARILSFEEFKETLEQISTAPHPDLTAHERGLCRLLLTLDFRLGLRPVEVYGLRIRDIEDQFIYVLPYAGYTLKSSNARRRVPSSVFLTPEELKRLGQFVQRCKEAGATDDSLLMALPTQEKVNRTKLDNFVHQVMRRVTGDPHARLYNARHSFASWTELALRCVDYPEILGHFAHLSETSAFLARGPELAKKLFGSSHNALGKSAFALCRLVGHIGPAITRMHYLHGDDLVRHAIVMREAARITVAHCLDLTCLKHSRLYDLMHGKVHLQAVVHQTRKALGWREVAEMPANDPGAILFPKHAPALAGATPAKGAPAAPGVTAGASSHGDGIWIPALLLLQALQSVALQTQDLSAAARYNRIDRSLLETLFEAIKAALPSVAQPGAAGERLAREGRVTLINGPQVRKTLQRIESWLLVRQSHDPVGLEADLEFLIDCYDRRDRDFHVRKSADLTRLAGLFASMSITPGEVQIILRAADRNAKTSELPACAAGGELGPYVDAPRRVIGVRAKEKASTYAKWVGLMPVSPAGEGWSNTLAMVAVAARCQLRIQAANQDSTVESTPGAPTS
jgi:integrase